MQNPNNTPDAPTVGGGVKNPGVRTVSVYAGHYVHHADGSSTFYSPEDLRWKGLHDRLDTLETKIQRLIELERAERADDK